MKIKEKIRCTYSPAFNIECYRSRNANKEKFGYVVGVSNDNTCWRIIWDGNKTTHSIHKDYITLLNSEQNVQERGNQSSPLFKTCLIL